MREKYDFSYMYDCVAHVDLGIRVMNRDRTVRRERRSFYLDASVIAKVNQAYREISHQLYPAEISKSLFLETLMGYGLRNLDDLKAALAQEQESST
jgi:hypothetical protein